MEIRNGSVGNIQHGNKEYVPGGIGQRKRNEGIEGVADGFSHSAPPPKETMLGKMAHSLKSASGKTKGVMGEVVKGAAFGALLGGVAVAPFLFLGPLSLGMLGAVGIGGVIGGALSFLESKGSGSAADSEAQMNMQTTLRTLNIPNMGGFSSQGPNQMNFH